MTKNPVAATGALVQLTRVYYFLAAFSIFTLLAALALNQRTIHVHDRSILIAAAFAELRLSAGEVNAPGNDIFDSKDVPAERARLAAAKPVFVARLKAVVGQLESLSSHSGVIEEAFASMVSEADKIMTYFAVGNATAAGERMATMDRRYADLNAAIAEHGSREIGAAESLRLHRAQYLVSLLGLMMVVGAVFYGRRIAGVLEMAESTRRRHIEDLEAAKESAQAASTAKSQFLANMSHEIRTPMNAILGMLALLRKTPLNARQADYAVKSESAARSLLRLLNDILDFSKVEAGKMTLEAHPFHVDQLVRDLSVIVSANVGIKPVAVRFDIDPALPRHLVGDTLRLQQVLINLSGNAVKFTDQGEVVLSMKVLAQDAGAVTVETAVRDTGIGIAPENQARIFSGFTQAEASTTRRFGGTGLGVAISQRLVALMGGELRLTSALGEGSRFYFRLSLPLAAHDDLADEGPALSAQVIVPSSQRLAGMRLLVVEDNLNNQQVARDLLEGEGATVRIANNGQEGVAAVAAAEQPFDVVLMDLQMPVMDGFTATERIRLGLGQQSLPIVAMTANAMDSDREACLAAGMNDHVGKPFDLNHLVNVLRHQVGRQALEVSEADAALPTAVIAVASATGVQVARAINRLGGKRDIYEHMLRRFLHDLDSTSEALQASAAAVDAPAMACLMHTMKGCAATLGAEALAAEAAHGEKMLNSHGSPVDAGLCAAERDRAIDAIATNRRGLSALLQALEQSAASSAAEPFAVDSTALREGLYRLAELLRESDMAAVNAMACLPRPVAIDLSARMQAMDASMAVLDFEPALSQCEELIRVLES